MSASKRSRGHLSNQLLLKPFPEGTAADSRLPPYLAGRHPGAGKKRALFYGRMPFLTPTLPIYPGLGPALAGLVKYYKKYMLSIEVVKENSLQKINFRFENKEVLRKDVVEVVKWNVDRSSPTLKILVFMN